MSMNTSEEDVVDYTEKSRLLADSSWGKEKEKEKKKEKKKEKNTNWKDDGELIIVRTKQNQLILRRGSAYLDDLLLISDSSSASSSSEDSNGMRIKQKVEPKKVKFPKCLCWIEWIVNFYYSDSIFGAIFSLSNSTIGGGVLFLPYVIREMGIIPGFLFIAFSGVLCSMTMYMLYKSYVKLSRTNPKLLDYEQIGKYCYGKEMSFFVQACVTILNYGCSLTYGVILSDLLAGWIPDKYWHALALALVLIPFVVISTSEKIASLRISGYLTVFSILSFIMLVAVSFFLGITEDTKAGEISWFPQELKDYRSYINILSVVGIVTFSFACHTNLCPIVSQFQPKNRYKSGVAIFFNIELIFLSYSLIAEFGYLSFLQATDSDIIKSYQGDGVIVSILRALVACAVCATYPMATYITRYTFNNVLFDSFELCCRKKKDTKRGVFRKTKTGKTIDFALNLLITSFIGVSTYLVALFFGKAAEIFSVVGSSASTCCSYIFPCLFFLRLLGKESKWYVKLGVYVILVYGVVFGAVSTIVSCMKVVLPDLFAYD